MSLVLTARSPNASEHTRSASPQATHWAKVCKQIEDNEVDELKPKVFNLVVSFNMFNWKENLTKEYGERETKMNDALEPATSQLSQYLIL